MNQPARHRGGVTQRGRRRRSKVLRSVLAATAVAATVVGVGAVPASAAAPPDPLAQGLAGPLSIDVAPGGSVLVGQSFAGLVSTVSRTGTVKNLLQEPGAEAVANGPFGTTIYSVTPDDHSHAYIKVRAPWGATWTLADVGAYETAHNPDGAIEYGAPDISEECAAEWPEPEPGQSPEEAPPPPVYTGQLDAHPYALAVAPWGVYVADAGANAILLVSWGGSVSTVAVLPPQPVTLTEELLEGSGLPACAAGLEYFFESVPTDIELSTTGAYVSLLPGGPETPELGARGKVVKVNLHNGKVTTYASGLLGATNVAVSPWGKVYATELFGGAVTDVTNGGHTPVAEFDTPAAVEWAGGKLYVAHDAFGNGTISVITP